MVQALTDNQSAQEIEKGISDYAHIGSLIDGGIPQQVEFDMQALQRAVLRSPGARTQIEEMSEAFG